MLEDVIILQKYNNGDKKMKTKCEVYSRTVGFIRPVNQWNVGKLEEFKNRKYLNLNEGETNE